MKFLAPFIAFNIIAIPALVFFHMEGECKILGPYLESTFPDFCRYVSNLGLNIAGLNAVLVLAGLLGASPKGGGGGGGGHSSKPSGGSKGH